MVEKEKTSRNIKKRIFIGIGFLLFAAIVAVSYWFYFVRGVVVSDDARIEGDLVDISPQISGRITAVQGVEGDYVNKGDIIAYIERDGLC